MLDRRLATANTYSFSVDGRRNDTRAKLESDAYMSLQNKLWTNGVRPSWWSEELSTTDIGVLDSGADIMAAYLETRLSFLDQDEVYYQYQQNLIPQSYWDGAKQSLKKSLTDPFERAVILDQIAPVRTIVDELINELAREEET